jgi:hypothetical protein
MKQQRTQLNMTALKNERNFGLSVRHVSNNFPLADRSGPNGMFNIDRAIGFDAVAGATILTMALVRRGNRQGVKGESPCQ